MRVLIFEKYLYVFPFSSLFFLALFSFKGIIFGDLVPTPVNI